MILLHVFWAFFIPSILGYGGGPPIIPLLQAEVVDHYGWMTLEQFGDVLALGNALPSPIATKLAGYIGYQVAGIPRAIVAVLLATLAFQFFASAYDAVGIWQTAALTAVSLITLEKLKIHPGIVVACGLAYGGVFLQ